MFVTRKEDTKIRNSSLGKFTLIPNYAREEKRVTKQTFLFFTGISGSWFFSFALKVNNKKLSFSLKC